MNYVQSVSEFISTYPGYKVKIVGHDHEGKFRSFYFGRVEDIPEYHKSYQVKSITLRETPSQSYLVIEL